MGSREEEAGGIGTHRHACVLVLFNVGKQIVNTQGQKFAHIAIIHTHRESNEGNEVWRNVGRFRGKHT